MLTLFFVASCGFNVELDNSGDVAPNPTGPTSPANVQIPNMLVAAFPGPGVYRENISVNINTIGFDEVYYCLSWSGECCKPTTVYTGSVGLTSEEDLTTYTPGEYCLSFVGVSSDFQTATQDYRYTVDNAIPSISTRINPIIGTNETMFIQTNQLDAYLRSDSDLFGFANYFHTAHNLGSQNPDTFAGCEDIYNNFPYATDGIMGSSGSLETDARNVSYVNTPLKKAIGINSYGDNFIVSVMRLSDVFNGDTFGCNTNRVVLKDFPIFRTSLSGNYTTGADANGVMEFQGGISHYGRFQGGTTSSASQPNQPYKLKVNFVDIVN